MNLRQATSATVMLGPFVDPADGFTPVTGLTIANTDIKISKNGAAWVNKNSGGGTHAESGYYAATFNSTDFSDVGTLQVKVHMAGALPVYHEFQIIEEAVYDRDYASTATGKVTVAAMDNDVITNSAIQDFAINNAKLASNTINSNKIATDAINAAALAADAASEIASAVWAAVARTLTDLNPTVVETSVGSALSTFGAATEASLLSAIADLAILKGRTLMYYGVAQGPGTGLDTLQLTSGQITSDDQMNDMAGVIFRGSGAGQEFVVIDTILANEEIQILGGAWDEAVDNTSVYLIFGN
jgi:hypothetical protein